MDLSQTIRDGVALATSPNAVAKQFPELKGKACVNRYFASMLLALGTLLASADSACTSPFRAHRVHPG